MFFQAKELPATATGIALHMASCVKPASMGQSSDDAGFSIRQARQIVHPYFRHRPWIYWIDAAVSTVIGYGFAAVYLESAPFPGGRLPPC